jgi:MFS family permease
VEPAEPSPTGHTSVGIYLALLQLFFTLTWTIYVIFLPKLAAQVGIRPQAVIMILMLDQAIFAFMDWLMGRLSDRWALVIGRLSRIVAVTTAVSCVAFLLLPFVAPTGSEALFLALTILWSASSSVLRAPPLALLGKYASRNSVPWLASLSMVGLGVAGALAPYLTVTFRDADPRLPFVLASVGLLFVTFGLGWAERNLAGAEPSSDAASAPAESVPSSTSSTAATRSPIVLFLIAIALLGLGFQIHFSLNTAPLFLKFAKPPELEQLMPVFWIGFSLLMLPTTFLTKRYGGLSVMAAGGVIGAQAAFIALHASNLTVLTAAQFVAGGAWGCVMMSAVTAALSLGHKDNSDGKGGNEGSITGALFSLLAIATFARMAIIWAELNKEPTFATIQPWLPVTAWLLAAGLLLAIALRRGDVEGGALQRV